MFVHFHSNSSICQPDQWPTIDLLLGFLSLTHLPIVCVTARRVSHWFHTSPHPLPVPPLIRGQPTPSSHYSYYLLITTLTPILPLGCFGEHNFRWHGSKFLSHAKAGILSNWFGKKWSGCLYSAHKWHQFYMFSITSIKVIE